MDTDTDTDTDTHTDTDTDVDTDTGTDSDTDAGADTDTDTDADTDEPGGGGGWVPALCRPVFRVWFWWRQGVDPLCGARFLGFARLKLLAVRAFEFGVSGTVERPLRLWAGLLSTPRFGTAQCQ